MFLGWGCKHFSLGPKKSVAQAQHFVSNPTNVLVPSRSLYNGFCIFSLPKGSGRIFCNTVSVSPALVVPPAIISSGWDSFAWCHWAQGSSYQCNKNTQLQHSLHCSPWYFASPGSGFPLPFFPLPPGHSCHLTLPCTSPLRQGGSQHSLEQGCSSWMPCNGCLYISPLCLLFPFFFIGALPSHRWLSSLSAPFLSCSWIVRAQPSPQQKEERLGVFGGQQKEKQRRVLFPVQASRNGHGSNWLHFSPSPQLFSFWELFCNRMWPNLWPVCKLALTQTHPNRIKQVSNKLVLCSWVKMAPTLPRLKADM